MDATLLAAGALGLLAGALFVAVGAVALRRPVTPEFRAPSRAFAFWWIGVGVNSALVGAVTLAAAAGVRDLALYVAHAHLERVVLAGSLWALVAYVAFVLTGNRRTWLPLALVYAGYYVVALYRLVSDRPVAVEVNEWARPALVGSSDALGLPLLLSLVLLVVPPVVAATLYSRLYFKTRDARQRVRIAMTSWGVLLWFLVSMGAYFVSGSALLQVADRLVGIALAALILRASTAHDEWLPRPRLVRRRPLAASSSPPQGAEPPSGGFP